tara:strand:+ start:1102 stop:1263 length:162 start_codon:yes stop_codon:yes gene_type:complete
MENIKLNQEELEYLIMIVEQNKEDYDDEYGNSYKEMLNDLYSKLIILKSKSNV